MVENTPAAEADREDEVDIGELFDLLTEGKWLVIAFTLVAALFGLAYASLSTPIYESDALVQLETDQSSSLSAIFGEMGDVLSAGSEAAAEIELIKSRLVLGRTVEQLDLHTRAQPEFFPLVGQGLARLAGKGLGVAQAVTAVFPEQYAHGGEHIVMGRFETPETLLNQPMTVELGADGDYWLYPPGGQPLRGQVGQTVRGEGATLAVQIQSLQGEPGRRFEVERADMLTAIQRLREALTVSEKGKDSGIISIRLQHPDPNMAARILNAVANNYLRQNVERKGEEAEQTLRYLQKQLPSLRGKLEAAEARLNAYRTSQGSADLMQETQILLQKSAELEALRLKLAQEREQLLQRFQPSHPTVQALDAQVRDVDRNRAELDLEVADLPETQQELLRLTRDVEVNTELYTSLLNSAQQLEVAKAGTVGNVRIVDYAGEPRRPVKPQRTLILALSVLLGLMLGVMAVFLRRALFSTLDDPQEFERRFGLPVYANVPVSGNQKKIFGSLKDAIRGMRTLEKRAESDPALEAVKSLRTALHFGLHDATNNIVLITGPRPGLGKSFVASNLAATLASAGRKVALVDGDLRRGTVHEYMGLSRRDGLSDVLAGRATLEGALRTPEEGGPHVLTSGTIPPNPSELLSTAAMKNLVQQLGAEHDVVIIDSPPNLAVADSSVLAQLAGSTLVVLRGATHPPREIAESLKRLALVGAQVRGVVFNMVKQHARRYGYGRYNYYYAYKSQGK